jgi:preprotein translocase subunit SecA
MLTFTRFPGDLFRDRWRLRDQTRGKIENLIESNAFLPASCLDNRNKESVVQDGTVIIVDNNTIGAMPGRRWSERFNQAVEPQERARVENGGATQCFPDRRNRV